MNGHAHWWLCQPPSDDGRVDAACRHCGEQRTFAPFLRFNGAPRSAKYPSRAMAWCNWCEQPGHTERTCGMAVR